MKKIYIHIIHILLFVAITFFYCWPIIEGEVVDSGDFKQFKGMSQEIEEHRTDTGEEALWTNRMFGGMPTFHMGVKYPNNILLTIDQIFQLGFPRPIGMIFICFLGFYILLLTLKLDLITILINLTVIEKSQAEKTNGNYDNNIPKKIRRNEKCYCGSGKKFKFCHGAL